MIIVDRFTIFLVYMWMVITVTSAKPVAKPIRLITLSSCLQLRRRGVTKRHDRVLRRIKDVAEEAGCSFAIEPRVHEGVRVKPDGCVTLVGVDSDLFLDVSVIHTLSPSYWRTTAIQQLNNRDSSKYNKYGALCILSGDDFRAFAITSVGVLSEQAKHVASEARLGASLSASSRE